jgi:microcystin-dependent protein
VPLETATYVSDLVLNNPAGSDPLAKSADHIRLVKAVLKATFGPLTGPLVNANGQLVLGDGSAAAPSHSFSTNSQIGFYLTTYGAIGVSGRMTGQGPVPIGAFIDFAGTTAPAGYLPCNGQAVSRTTYAELFTAIGTTWGAGDGSTTFNVPPMADRYRRHAGGTYGGAVGTLQNPDVTPHTHLVAGNTGTESADHSHSFSGTTQGMNANNPHAHSVVAPGSNTSTGGGAFACAAGVGNTSTAAANIDHGHAFSGSTSGVSQAHTHAINFASGSFGTSETRPYSATVLTCIRAL